jgi:hypothetical protein
MTVVSRGSRGQGWTAARENTDARVAGLLPRCHGAESGDELGARIIILDILDKLGVGTLPPAQDTRPVAG